MLAPLDLAFLLSYVVTPVVLQSRYGTLRAARGDTHPVIFRASQGSHANKKVRAPMALGQQDPQIWIHRGHSWQQVPSVPQGFCTPLKAASNLCTPQNRRPPRRVKDRAPSQAVRERFRGSLLVAAMPLISPQ